MWWLPLKDSRGASGGSALLSTAPARRNLPFLPAVKLLEGRDQSITKTFVAVEVMIKSIYLFHLQMQVLSFFRASLFGGSTTIL